VLIVSKEDLCFKIIVVSDRVLEGLDVDISGDTALKILKDKGLNICGKVTIGNSYRDIIRVIRESKERVLLFIGGTGPSPRDITVDVVENIAWRCLPGFGELFRFNSYQQIGVRAILSRSTLCITHDGKITVVLPGSPSAVSIGLEILSQVVNHLVEEVDRYETPHRSCR
jgi:molybdenum cofactor biosynthesis protein B